VNVKLNYPDSKVNRQAKIQEKERGRKGEWEIWGMGKGR